MAPKTPATTRRPDPTSPASTMWCDRPAGRHHPRQGHPADPAGRPHPRVLVHHHLRRGCLGRGACGRASCGSSTSTCSPTTSGPRGPARAHLRGRRASSSGARAGPSQRRTVAAAGERAHAGSPSSARAQQGSPRRSTPPRAQLAPIVIEGEPSSTSDQPGGQLMLTTEVENFPGFDRRRHGSRPHGQACAPRPLRFGADLRVAKVLRADLSARPFQLWIDAGRRARPHRRRGDRRDRAHGRCRSSVPGEDAPPRPRPLHVRDLRRVLLPGPGDRGRGRRRLRARRGALPHAVRDQGHGRCTGATSCAPRGSCSSAPSPTRRSSSSGTPSSTEVLGEESVHSLARARHGDRRRRPRSTVTGVFVAIGHEPNTSLVEGPARPRRERLRRHPERLRRRPSRASSPPGDVQDHVYRQAITSAGSGCMAAIDAERWLEAHGPLAGPGTSRGARRVVTLRQNGGTHGNDPDTHRCDLQGNGESARTTPILVDFWAEWCGPCKQIAPILEEIASEQEGRLSIGKLNVDDNLRHGPGVLGHVDPDAHPVQGGEPVARLVGAKPKGALLQELSAYL